MLSTTFRYPMKTQSQLSQHAKPSNRLRQAQLSAFAVRFNPQIDSRRDGPADMRLAQLHTQQQLFSCFYELLLGGLRQGVSSRLCCCQVTPGVDGLGNLQVVRAEQFLRDVDGPQVQGVRLLVLALYEKKGSMVRGVSILTTGKSCQTASHYRLSSHVKISRIVQNNHTAVGTRHFGCTVCLQIDSRSDGRDEMTCSNPLNNIRDRYIDDNA